MIDLLPSWPLLSAFLLASLVLAVMPGPGVFYIITRSIVHGRRAGLVSVAGIALGNLGNAFAASLGLAALFAVSSLAFSVLKFAGALYLVYLGIQLLRSSSSGYPTRPPAAEPDPRLFRDGFFVALFNPKTTLFFAAFLPQFLSSDSAPMLQSMALGSLFVMIAAMTDSLYALVADKVAAVVNNPGMDRHARRAGGGLFICLGLFAVLTGSK